MKVCGFTIVRNALKFGYPVTESIRSLLPLCDQFLVSVGNSEDETIELIRSIDSPKIRIMESTWDDSLRSGGRVLAAETNKAFDSIGPEYDWVFYIQADEVLHEQYLPVIKAGMEQWNERPEAEGLLFHYLHFYGTYDYVGDSRRWYRKEIRIIRNDKNIRSWLDAQGFRKNGQKLKVKPVEAYIYHYGWVKHPGLMKNKEKYFHTLWHDDEWMKQHVKDEPLFDYSQVDSLSLFNGTHPEVMKKRLEEINWKFELDIRRKNFRVRDRFLYWIEKKTGVRIGEYKNYKLI
jgi:hypothetical protein